MSAIREMRDRAEAFLQAYSDDVTWSWIMRGKHPALQLQYGEKRALVPYSTDQNYRRTANVLSDIKHKLRLMGVISEEDFAKGPNGRETVMWSKFRDAIESKGKGRKDRRREAEDKFRPKQRMLPDLAKPPTTLSLPLPTSKAQLPGLSSPPLKPPPLFTPPGKPKLEPVEAEVIEDSEPMVAVTIDDDDFETPVQIYDDPDADEWLEPEAHDEPELEDAQEDDIEAVEDAALALAVAASYAAEEAATDEKAIAEERLAELIVEAAFDIIKRHVLPLEQRIIELENMLTAPQPPREVTKDDVVRYIQGLNGAGH